MPYNKQAKDKPWRKYRDTNRCEFDCTILCEPMLKVKTDKQGNQTPLVILKATCHSHEWDKTIGNFIPLFAYGDLARRIYAGIYKGCSIFCICKLTSHKIQQTNIAFGFEIQRVVITNYPASSIDEEGNPVNPNTGKQPEEIQEYEEMFQDFPTVPWYPIYEEPSAETDENCTPTVD